MNYRLNNTKSNILIAIIFAAFPFLCAATEGEEVLIICLALSIVIAVLWVSVWSIRKLFSSTSTTTEKTVAGLGLIASLVAIFIGNKMVNGSATDSRGRPIPQTKNPRTSSRIQTNSLHKKQSTSGGSVNMPRSQQKKRANCYQCSGRGYLDRCDYCKNQGVIHQIINGMNTPTTCPVCRGNPRQLKCSDCNGSGKARFG